MKRAALVVVTMAFGLTVGVTALAEAPFDEEVVCTMVPQSLPDELVEDGRDPEDVRFAFVRWPSTNGTSQILAVYVTDLTSELSLIRLSDPPFQEDSLKFPVGGHTPRLTLRDLDNDSKPEALWELPLDRKLLVNVLTVEDGKVLLLNEFGVMAEVRWHDLDGDGILEGISSGSSPGLTSDGQPDPVRVSPVFGFVDGTLFQQKEIFALETFYSSYNSSDPPEVSTVFLGRLDVQYRLRIVPNGPDDLPQGRSADIVWNGVTVMTAAAFAQNTPPFTVNVVPKRENTLELRNITPDQSSISVVVEAAAPIVPLKVSPVVE